MLGQLSGVQYEPCLFGAFTWVFGGTDGTFQEGPEIWWGIVWRTWLFFGEDWLRVETQLIGVPGFGVLVSIAGFLLENVDHVFLLVSNRLYVLLVIQFFAVDAMVWLDYATAEIHRDPVENFGLDLCGATAVLEPTAAGLLWDLALSVHITFWDRVNLVYSHYRAALAGPPWARLFFEATANLIA